MASLGEKLNGVAGPAVCSNTRQPEPQKKTKQKNPKKTAHAAQTAPTQTFKGASAAGSVAYLLSEFEECARTLLQSFPGGSCWSASPGKEQKKRKGKKMAPHTKVVAVSVCKGVLNQEKVLKKCMITIILVQRRAAN